MDRSDAVPLRDHSSLPTAARTLDSRAHHARSTQQPHVWLNLTASADWITLYSMRYTVACVPWTPRTHTFMVTAASTLVLRPQRSSHITAHTKYSWYITSHLGSKQQKKGPRGTTTTQHSHRFAWVWVHTQHLSKREGVSN